MSLAEDSANRFIENNYRFVPLVQLRFSLLCNINVLFLRHDTPGSVFSAGDLDNRVKTLIDALRKPKSPQELRGYELPSDGEDPFFCLLEDDDLVTGFSVETDTLLKRCSQEIDDDLKGVHLVISIEIKPYDATVFNLNFV